MVDVSIILSSYNSAALLEARVHDFEAVLARHLWSWEILLCDDGSSDQTRDICQGLVESSPKRRFFSHPVNQGRGATVRSAILQSQGRFIGYADMDRSTPADYLVPVLQALESGYDVAETSRKYVLKPITFPFIAHRYLAHKTYAWLVKIILGIEGHDTEAGFKFFRRDALLELHRVTHAARWFWDTEIIANAHRLGLRVAEIPSLFVRIPFQSTVHLLPDSIRQLRHLLHYARHYGRDLRRTCCR